MIKYISATYSRNLEMESENRNEKFEITSSSKRIQRVALKEESLRIANGKGRSSEKSDANEKLKVSSSAELFCDDGV